MLRLGIWCDLIRPQRLIWCFYLACCLLLLPVDAPAGDPFANPSILWAVSEEPAYFSGTAGVIKVTKSSRKVGDRLISMLIDELSDMKSTIEVMPIARIIDGLASKRELCFFSAARSPDRDAVALWTPLSVSPSVALIVRPELLASHPDWQGGVNLREILALPGLSGQYNAARRFGSAADAIIAAAPATNLKANALAHPQNEMRMVLERRIDYALEYPSDLDDLERIGSFKPGALRPLPIRDIDPLTQSYILCPKSEWGREVMLSIDRIMRKIALTEAYRNAVNDEFTPGLRQFYKKEIDNFIAERARFRG